MRIEARLQKIGGYIPPIRWLYHKYRKREIGNLVRDLPRFFDCVESTEIAGRWWLWSGAMLGFIRSGKPIEWDHDVDFAIERKDIWLLVRSLPKLKKMGYRPKRNFVDRDGVVFGIHLSRRGIIYDFFILDDVDSNTFSYSQFGVIDGQPVRQICEIPRQKLTTRDMLGRPWPCASDQEVELTAIYGNWRVPDPTWSYLSSPSVRRSEPWGANLDSWEELTDPSTNSKSCLPTL